MIKNSQRENGSTHGVIIIVAVVVLLGVLGYIAWNNFFAPKDKIGNTNETINTADDSQVNVGYKTVKINDHNFRYPLNKSNERIIIISDNSTLGLQDPMVRSEITISIKKSVIAVNPTWPA
jgi:hypothetical protein